MHRTIRLHRSTPSDSLIGPIAPLEHVLLILIRGIWMLVRNRLFVFGGVGGFGAGCAKSGLGSSLLGVVPLALSEGLRPCPGLRSCPGLVFHPGLGATCRPRWPARSVQSRQLCRIAKTRSSACMKCHLCGVVSRYFPGPGPCASVAARTMTNARNRRLWRLSGCAHPSWRKLAHGPGRPTSRTRHTRQCPRRSTQAWH